MCHLYRLLPEDRFLEETPSMITDKKVTPAVQHGFFQHLRLTYRQSIVLILYMNQLTEYCTTYAYFQPRNFKNEKERQNVSRCGIPVIGSANH